MFFSYRANAQSQFYLSEVWDKDGGTMPMFYKSASVLDNQRNVYVVGSTATDSSGFDILIQKFSPIGVLLWETTFDGGTNLDDYGVALYVDDDYQVFVTGAATQAVEHDLDLVVLKLDSEGYLLWTYFYYNYGSPIPYDGGTSITADNISGSVYVTGTSAGESTMMDYVAIKLAAEDGDEIWVNRYDYAGYNEMPSNITLSGSLIHVTGVSQSDFVVDQWEIAIVSFAEDDPFTPINHHLPYHTFGAEKMDYAFSLHIRLNEELSLLEHTQNKIKAYPNPTNDIITLDYGDISVQNIQVIDASGRVIQYTDDFTSVNNRVEITHLQSLSTGLYFIKVLSTEQESFTIKIIKK